MLLRVTIFAMLLAAAAAVECAGKPNGKYDISCKSYTVCSNGQATIVHCEQYYVVDETVNCKNESLVGLPCGLVRDYSNKADGSYPDSETGCASYYTCHNKTYYGHQHCPGGTVFDEVNKYCTWDYEVCPPCGTKQC